MSNRAYIGEDAAYQRLVSAAYEIGKREVERIAADLTFDCREAVIGMAACDLDDCAQKMQDGWPFNMVFDVAKKLNDDPTLLQELCTVALNPKIADHLPFGMLERVKAHLKRKR